MRPSAAQAFRAGYQPSTARARHGSWFGLLFPPRTVGRRRGTGARHGGGRPRRIRGGVRHQVVQAGHAPGAPTRRHTPNRRRGRAGSPRLPARSCWATRGSRRDVDTTEIPEVVSVEPQRWAAYWRKWPLAAWVGELKGTPGRWFRLEGERFVPTFSVDPALGDAFDAMAAEVVEYRLARYLVGKEEAVGGGVGVQGESRRRPPNPLHRPQAIPRAARGRS